MRRRLTPEERRETIARLERWSRLLDDKFRVPGTRFRFGWDAILGLIPGFGDTAAGIFSTAMAFEARRLGIPGIVQIRMMGNVLIDALVGAIPFLGDLFDFVWKANARNLALLRRHADPGIRPTRGDWIFVAAFMLVIAIALAIPLMIVTALVQLLGPGPTWQLVLVPTAACCAPALVDRRAPRRFSPYRDYKWIVADSRLLGGKPAIRGTRLSVSLVLSCLAEGMTTDEIEESYGPFPREALREILKAASEALDSPHVAA